MYSEIKECIICKGGLQEVLDLGNQYVVDFVKEKDDSLLKAPLTLMRCTKCSFIQLKHRVNQDRLYKKFWYRSGINEQMKTELAGIVDKAQTVIELALGDKVLDIGCNDGTMLGNYPKGVTTFGVDPCASLVEEGLKKGMIDVGIPDYFSESALLTVHKMLGIKQISKFKVITAISCFYDVTDPIQFLRDCKTLLHDEGVLIIQMNYLMTMLKDTAFDNICHEHVGYYSVSTLNEAVKLAGLEMQGVEESSCNGGSIRAYITHKGFDKFSIRHSGEKLWLVTKMDRLLIEEMKAGLHTDLPYKDFSLEIQFKMVKIRKMIGCTDKPYVYGASTRGTVLMQTLCQSMFPSKFVGVAERDENKIGLKMVGTWLNIITENEFRNNAKHALILPWHFEKSIIRREEEWLSKGGKFIVPLPTPHVIEKSITENLITSSREI